MHIWKYVGTGQFWVPGVGKCRFLHSNFHITTFLLVRDFYERLPIAIGLLCKRLDLGTAVVHNMGARNSLQPVSRPLYYFYELFSGGSIFDETKSQNLKMVLVK